MGLWDDFYKTQTQGQYQPPNFSDLYGAYNKTSAPMLNVQQPPASSTIQPTQQQPQQPHPLLQLVAQLLAPKQQTAQPTGNNFAAMLSAVRNDPVGDFNKLAGLPSYAPGSLSPFNTGFFNNTQGAQVSAYPNQMRKDYTAPMLPASRLAELRTQLYKNPRSLYQ